MYGIVGAYQTQGKNAQALKKLWEGICSGLHHAQFAAHESHKPNMTSQSSGQQGLIKRSLKPW